MLKIPSHTRIYLALAPVDMRRSFDGLCAIVAETLKLNPMDGHLFLFRGKSADRVKCLLWDRNGFVIGYKRLEKGSYLRSRLPHEHKRKEVVICICCGGEIKEDVRELLRGFLDGEQSRTGVSFEEWDGDKLAGLIEKGFLREEVMPDRLRSLLRKSIAILDEPMAARRARSGCIRLC